MRPAHAPPPPIAPPGEGGPRPFWSVMIPCYEPDELLERSLRSVLDQDPGPDRMQIAVVDDRSPTVDVGALVGRVAPGRVEVHRAAENLGLAGNWNRCVALARGRWVHLLHQDDLVRPGFYDRLARADADPAVGLAFCQAAIFADDDQWQSISALERGGAGVVADWAGRILEGQRLFCPAVVVRRSAYEAVGGFRSDLDFVLDWEMWARLACRHAAWFEPSVLACYRVHPRSETSRLRRLGLEVADGLRGIEIVRGYAPEALRDRVGVGLRAMLVNESLAQVARLLEDGEVGDALRLLGQVARRFPPGDHTRLVLRLYRWALKLRLVGLARSVGRRPRGPAGASADRSAGEAAGVLAGESEPGR